MALSIGARLRFRNSLEMRCGDRIDRCAMAEANKRPDTKDQLRRGWTTGACATAATKAAVGALLGDEFPEVVTITLPRGGAASFALVETRLENGGAVAAVIKDAGDDPDVTHGCKVRVRVQRSSRPGVHFHAGEGIGTVTKPGLALAPGEPAINPVPRHMIEAVLQAAAARKKVPCAFEVTIAIPGGQEIAKKTLNARLGIVGGLSILGTTGVVVPFSCASWIHSIHRGIDVARAAGREHIAAATGSTSEAFLNEHMNLPDEALIDMGDFVGGTLKYLRRHPVPRLTLAGGIGKFTKLAQGALDLHSARSTLDREGLARRLGGPSEFQNRIRNANTALEVLELATATGIGLGEIVATDARDRAQTVLGKAIAVEVFVLDRSQNVVGHARGW